MVNSRLKQRLWSARLGAKRAAVAGYGAGVTLAQMDSRRLRGLRGGDRVLILNLHSVEPPGTTPIGGLDPRLLDDLVGWLRRRARLVTIAELDDPGPDKRPLVVLSFDDGYRDFAEYALPVLEKHGVRVNHNVIPGCADRGRPPWNVELMDALATLAPARLAVASELGAAPARELAFSSPTRFAELAVLKLKRLPGAEREPLLVRLADRLPELASVPPRAMLTAAEIRSIARDHEIGAHSFEHESMELESDEHFAADLARCRAWFDGHGLPLGVYAFPNGSHRPEQLAIAAHERVRTLLVGERPAVRTEPALHRVTMFGSSLRELRARIARALA